MNRRQPVNRRSRNSAVVICVAIAAFTHLNPLSADGDTNEISSTCEKHSLEMQKRIVPIAYGFPRESEFEEMQASREMFPNGRIYILGGCVVRAEDKATIYVCPKCEEARTEWVKSKGYEELNTPQDFE